MHTSYEHDLHKNLIRATPTTLVLLLLNTSTRFLRWHSLSIPANVA
jgi:hypothetical protein